LAWDIDYSDTAKKQLNHLDRQVAKRILDFIDERVAIAENPRSLGKALHGPFGGYWRYSVGDYRVICEILDRKISILVLKIGDRKEIYRGK
jgi:mRNA interferase RelE/StbE